MQAQARLEALTGARFLAAILVIAGHLSWLTGRPGLHPTPTLRIMTHHSTAVGFFFCLSGFVMAYSYADRVGSPWQRRRYLLQRFARIYPMHLLAILAFVPLGLLNGDRFVWLPLQIVGLNAWAARKDALFSWHGGIWSISVELFFYVAFLPVAAHLLPRIRSVRRALILTAALVTAYAVIFLPVAISTTGFNPWIYGFPAFRFLEFLLGCTVAWIYRHRDGRALPTPCGPLLGALLAASLFTLYGQQHEENVWAYPLILLPASLGVIYWLASEHGAVHRFLASPALVRLGDASYALYLLHALVLWQAGEFVRGRYGASGWPLIAAGAVGVTGAILLSLVTHALVERPARALVLRAFGVAPDRPDREPWPARADPL